jgi:hypothetical protein
MYILISNSLVSRAIWKNIHTREFLKLKLQIKKYARTFERGVLSTSQRALCMYMLVEVWTLDITKVTELWNRIKNSYIDHSHKRLRPRLHIFACLQF